MSEVIDRLNEIAARWEHGHPEPVKGCALCNGEWAEVYAVLFGPVVPASATDLPCDPDDTRHWFGECPRCQVCACGQFEKNCVCGEGDE